MIARVFLLAIVAYIVQNAEASFATDAENLRTLELFDSTYDPAVRPNGTVNVKAGFSLFTIDSVNTAQQSFIVTGWFTLKWNDGRLTWLPSSYGNIQEMHVGPNEVWKPEVIIDNSLADIGVINDDNLQLTVTHTGDVVWEPPGLYTTHCEIDVTYYPFDRQRCVIELTSWSMTKDQLELEHLSSTIDTEDFRINGEWIIVSTSVKDEDLQNTRPDGVVETSCQLDFIFILERRPAFYAINFILPIILSSFLSCVVFLVPIQAGEKVSYILTLILAIAVLLTLIADSLPHTSLTACILGIYLATTMFLSVISAVITVLLLCIFHNKDKVDTTSKFYKLTILISNILCREGRKRRSRKGNSATRNKVVPNGAFPSKKMNLIMEDVDDVDKQGAETSATVDRRKEKVFTWEEIAKIWDRFCFRAIFTLTLVCTFAFLVTLALGDKHQYV